MEEVTREEFNLYLMQQNGSLRRIEDRLCRLEGKIDHITEELGKRVTQEEFERVRHRMPPVVAALIAVLSSGVTGLLVALFTVVR